MGYSPGIANSQTRLSIYAGIMQSMKCKCKFKIYFSLYAQDLPLSHFFLVLYKFIDFYPTISPRYGLLYYELLSHSLGLKIHVTTKHADSYLSSVGIDNINVYYMCVFVNIYISRN